MCCKEGHSRVLHAAQIHPSPVTLISYCAYSSTAQQNANIPAPIYSVKVSLQYNVRAPHPHTHIYTGRISGLEIQMERCNSRLVGYPIVWAEKNFFSIFDNGLYGKGAIGDTKCT
ncbi:hypothetical protein AVEN_96487-1 [Araneus ventricosus]|uniref:Uncharacterized protein n=1 Tax=Araneus ventricosus TaxID=182803 RepID=A0A4Y2CVW8_ARAVE|nr:hypothetical protein AVEN_96487-1 [Araneus ventricosus]